MKYQRDFTESLQRGLKSFVKDFRPEIVEKGSVINIANLLPESKVRSSIPEVYKLILLFITIPVTSERSSSD